MSPHDAVRWFAVTAALVLIFAGPARAEPEAPTPVVARHGWQIEVTGYIQADAIAYASDSTDAVASDGKLLNKERFLIRRGRVRTEARKDALSAAIELDGNTGDGATARLISASVGWQYKRTADPRPLVTLTAGLFKTPFGVEVPAPERDKPFLEPPAFARALVPGNYDAGVMARGSYAIARWSIAFLNGAPSGDLQWKGKDPSSSHDIVGRFGADIAGPRTLRLEIGGSALVGTGLHGGTAATKDTLKWVDDNNDGVVQTAELRGVPAMEATPSEHFGRHAVGVDVQLHWCICRIGNGTAFAEAAFATNLDRGLIYADPVTASRDLRERGLVVGVVQDLGAHASVGARYDRYEADYRAPEKGDGTPGDQQLYSAVSAMGSVRWHDLRLVLQYDRERTPTVAHTNRISVRVQVGF